MNKRLTIVQRVYKPGLVYSSTIEDVIDIIRTGNFFGYDLKGITQRIQSWNIHEKQNELKYRYLPVALFNGEFSYKNNDSILSYSSYTAMDFDGFATESELQQIGYWLTQTQCVYVVFRTPSGKGLKAIVFHDNTNAAFHDELYDALLSKFRISTTDTSVSDVSRGNYLCYDPRVWVNQNCKPFHFIHNPGYIPKTKVCATSNLCTVSDIKTLEFWLDLKNPVGNKSDESIINILVACWKKQPERWKQGNRANSVFRAASEFCNAGVKMSRALESLIKIYTNVGLAEDEITYQTHRGYICNANTYGVNRSRFDSYGSKRRH